MSPPGFDGGFDARVSLVEGEARGHAESEEVSDGNQADAGVVAAQAMGKLSTNWAALLKSCK